MVSSEVIENGMPVISIDGFHFAVVDHVEGQNVVKLKRDHEGKHHYIPLEWVRAVAENTAYVDREKEQIFSEWSTSRGRVS